LQRNSKRESRLSENKISLLNQIGFPWVGRIYTPPKKEKLTKIKEDRWEIMFEILTKYHNKNNTCIIPTNTDFKELRIWTYAQRAHFNKGILSKSRINLLNELNFPWKLKKGAIPQKKKSENTPIPYDEVWSQKFESLKEYYLSNNTCNVHKKINSQLNIWCGIQRHKNNSNKLSENRIALLNSIEFPWKVKMGKEKINKIKNTFFREEQWEEMFLLLCEYYNQHQNFEIPKNAENSKLISWINTQIIFRRKGKIKEYRLEKLNSINFTWTNPKPLSNKYKRSKLLSPKQEKDWEGKYQKLILFVKKNGHTKIPRTTRENESLSTWLVLQRKNFRENKLPQIKIDLFIKENIDLSYTKVDDFKESWIKKYNLLLDYFNQNGHSKYPLGRNHDKALANWIFIQKREMKKGELEDYKFEKLNKINFDWENKVKNIGGINKYWQEKFDLLVKFKNQFNSVSVPQSNKEIGRWVNDQRVNFKRGKLSEQKIAMLSEIGFIWVAKKS
jgi:hypothetical protein